METTYIISDIHLGSDTSQAGCLCGFLDEIKNKTQRLILNGDVFESMDFRRLKKNHWHVLSALRKMSDHVEVIWVAGNHDGPAEIISHLLGLTVVEEYEFFSGDKKVLVLHGHVFDDFLDDHPILTWVGDMIYMFLQKVDNTHYIARQAKHSSKHYLRCADIIKKRAQRLAKKKACQVVCCGHTHHAEMDLEGPVHYYNSGCWTEIPNNYIEITDGIVTLNSFDEHERRGIREAVL